MPQNKVIDRRQLLKVICASTGALCGAGAVGCGGKDDASPDPIIRLPAVSAGKLLIAVKDFPSLGKVGGGLVGQADGSTDPVAIMRESETQFSATSGLCTHMSCVLRFNQLNATLDCACHGSTFELDGSVINGPATKPLARLSTEFDGQTLRIVFGA
jgi:Rieske Fe-S protein